MTEIPHFTEEQVQEALAAGLRIADALGLEGDAHHATALWAAQKLSEKTIMQGAPALLPMQGMIR